MGSRTGIEWTDATWNPIIGCSRVSEGCRNCYAETIAGRFGAGKETVYSGLTQIVNGRAVWTGQIKETKQLLQQIASETPEEQLHRYELTFRAIAQCTLVGADFGVWVQSVIEDALSGLWPECWNCGTYVHDGPCAGESDDVEVR
jgi:hypothetical protein